MGMSTVQSKSASVSRGVVRWAWLVAIISFFPIVMGSIVRVSGSGTGCGSAGGGSWPLCNGHFLPKPDAATLIEFSHRMFATLLTIAVVVFVIWAVMKYRHVAVLMWGSLLTLLFLVVQVALGAITVKLNLAGPLVFIHLANAEILFGIAVTTALGAGGVYRKGQGMSDEKPYRKRRLRVAIIAAVGTYLVIIAGSLVVNTPGAAGTCYSWPFCGTGLGFSIPSTGPAALSIFHRLLAGVVALFVGFVAGTAMGSHKADPRIRMSAMLVNVTLLLQIVIGAIMAVTKMAPFWETLHLAFATLFWGSMVALLVGIWMQERLHAPEAEDAHAAAPQRSPA